ncbi:MAG: hypothetical protein U0Y68_22225 [Blastocatellia bacterium]
MTVDAARYQPAAAPDSIVRAFSGLTATEARATDDADSVTPGIQLLTSPSVCAG